MGEVKHTAPSPAPQGWKSAPLDAHRLPSEGFPVETPAIKVIGQLHKTPWQRFVRLQRTAAKLAQGRGQPKGVFRFSSHAECNLWTIRQAAKKSGM
jgi:hypothetical protein